MQQNASAARRAEGGATIAPDELAHAFEHSITWEDDIWRADPVDVPAVHQKARRKFADLLGAVTSGRGAQTPARILLFHGQSGAGKTHLIRALRTSAHREGTAYFGYAQMTPDIANYADYYLRRLVHSLEKSYDPDRDGESALQRLTNLMVEDAEVVSANDLEALREAPLDAPALARLVLRIADEVVAAPKYAEQDLDINIVRALLYLQRRDPRVDQRVRQYLHGRHLTMLAAEAVAALDPNTGEDRAFEIITSLGKLMWTVDRAAMVFVIDQVEDLRFFDNAEERFQKAVRDLIQIANRLSNAIVVISCLEDFYGQVRGVLAQSYIDRIEKSGPVALLESRTPEEARLIIARRLEHEAEARAGGPSFPDPSAFFGPDFFEEFGGLSTRRLLEHAQRFACRRYLALGRTRPVGGLLAVEQRLRDGQAGAARWIGAGNVAPHEPVHVAARRGHHVGVLNARARSDCDLGAVAGKRLRHVFVGDANLRTLRVELRVGLIGAHQRSLDRVGQRGHWPQQSYQKGRSRSSGEDLHPTHPQNPIVLLPPAQRMSWRTLSGESRLTLFRS